MQLQCITTSDGLADPGLASAWNRLASESPFASWNWLEAWWRHYGEPSQRGGRPSELRTIAVRDDTGRLVGLAPFYLDPSAWQGRVLRFLGTHGVCSDYLGVIADPWMEAEVAATIADWLTGDATGDWDLIEVEGVDADDRATRELASHMKSRGCLVNVRPGANCWRLDLPRDWERYLATLSRTQRKRVRRYEREMFLAGHAVLLTVDDEVELGQALETLVDLHQQRQISLGNSGSFACARFTAFHFEVTRRMLRSGRLRLHYIEVHGHPSAVQYDLAGTQTVYSYQGGIDPRADVRSPGQLMTLATLKLAIEQGFRGYDFLRGDEPYKATWRASPRPSARLRIVAAHTSARLRHGVWVAAKTLKDQLASGLRSAGALEAQAHDD